MRRGKNWIVILGLEIGVAIIFGVWYYASHKKIAGDPVTDAAPLPPDPGPPPFVSPVLDPPRNAPQRVPESRPLTSRPARWGTPTPESAPAESMPSRDSKLAPAPTIATRRRSVVLLQGHVKTSRSGRPVRSTVEALFQAHDEDVHEYITRTADDGTYTIPCRPGDVDVVISVTPIWSETPTIISLEGEIRDDHPMNDVIIDEPAFTKISVHDDKGAPIADAGIHPQPRTPALFHTDDKGFVEAVFEKKKTTFVVAAIGYEPQTVTRAGDAPDETVEVVMARDTRAYLKLETATNEIFAGISVKCSAKVGMSDVAYRANEAHVWEWRANEEGDDAPMEIELGRLTGPGGLSIAGLPADQPVKFTFRWQRLEYTTNITLKAGEWKDVVVKLPWKYPILAGVVKDDTAPIAGALVRLHTANDLEMVELRTDKDGRFSTPWPHSGDAEAVIAASGYAPRVVRIAVNGAAATREIRLGAEHSMVVKIRDADGVPVDPDRVIAKWSWGDSPGVQTTIGEYEFRDLPAELIVVQATIGLDDHVIAVTEDAVSPVLSLPPLGSARIEWSSDTYPARVRLDSPDGPSRYLEHTLSREEKRRSGFTMKGLMPGRYRATLLDPKGKRIGRYIAEFMVGARQTCDAFADEPPLTPEVK